MKKYNTVFLSLLETLKKQCKEKKNFYSGKDMYTKKELDYLDDVINKVRLGYEDLNNNDMYFIHGLIQEIHFDEDNTASFNRFGDDK